MKQTIIIDPRFNGPPAIGNGGYVAGQVGKLIGGIAEVTLRRPVPLVRSLATSRLSEGGVALHDGDTVLANAEPVHILIEPPDAPAYAEAEAARTRAAIEGHPFPACFVPGSPGRAEGDGLRIIPGPLGRDGMVAAPWIPDASLADAGGRVRPEFIWAALDCPGGVAAVHEQPRPIVLGRMAARIRAVVWPGARYIVAGWRIAAEERRHRTGTAIFTADGRRIAEAEATWIEVAA